MVHILHPTLQLDQAILLFPKLVTLLNVSTSIFLPDLVSLLHPQEDHSSKPRAHITTSQPVSDTPFLATQRNYILPHLFSHSTLFRHVL